MDGWMWLKKICKVLKADPLLCLLACSLSLFDTNKAVFRCRCLQYREIAIGKLGKWVFTLSAQQEQQQLTTGRGYSNSS